METSVTVADSEVLSSGTVVTTPRDGLTIHVGSLSYQIVFDDQATEQGVSVEKISEDTLRIQLRKFTNSLGTSVHAMKAGQVGDEIIWLSLYVEDVAGESRVVSYTFYLGGELG